jgi:hypothetical protein
MKRIDYERQVSKSLAQRKKEGSLVLNDLSKIKSLMKARRSKYTSY